MCKLIKEQIDGEPSVKIPGFQHPFIKASTSVFVSFRTCS